MSSPFLNNKLQQWTLLSPCKFQVKFWLDLSILTVILSLYKIQVIFLTWVFYTDRYFFTIQTSSHIFDLISIYWNMWTNVTKCCSKCYHNVTKCHIYVPWNVTFPFIEMIWNVGKCNEMLICYKLLCYEMLWNVTKC